jgi:hypothetical protein
MKSPRKIQSAKDYKNFEHQLVTFESVPSVDGGLIPDIHKGGMDAKMKFNEMSLSLVTGSDGVDIIGKAINPSYEQKRETHFGTFEGNYSPTNIFQMAESFQNEALASNADMDMYCAVIGIAFEQDAVPYMKAESFDPNATNKHFGLQLDFENDIDAERFAQLGELFQHYASGVEFTVVGNNSLRAVNFRGDDGVPFAMSDVEFIQKVIKVAEKYPSDEELSISRMSVTGNYIFNDWQEDPEGQNYKSLLRSNGREDLIELAEHVRSQFLEKVKVFSQEMNIPEKTQKRMEADTSELSL